MWHLGFFRWEPGPSASPNDSEKIPDWITSLSPGWSGKPQLGMGMVLKGMVVGW